MLHLFRNFGHLDQGLSASVVETVVLIPEEFDDVVRCPVGEKNS